MTKDNNKETHKAQGEVKGGEVNQENTDGKVDMDTEKAIRQEVESFKKNYLSQIGIDPDVIDKYLDFEDYVKFVVNGLYTQYVMEMIEQQRRQAQQAQQATNAPGPTNTEEPASVSEQAQQVKDQINQEPEQL